MELECHENSFCSTRISLCINWWMKHVWGDKFMARLLAVPTQARTSTPRPTDETRWLGREKCFLLPFMTMGSLWTRWNPCIRVEVSIFTEFGPALVSSRLDKGNKASQLLATQISTKNVACERAKPDHEDNHCTVRASSHGHSKWWTEYLFFLLRLLCSMSRYFFEYWQLWFCPDFLRPMIYIVCCVWWGAPGFCFPQECAQ